MFFQILNGVNTVFVYDLSNNNAIFNYRGIRRMFNARFGVTTTKSSFIKLSQYNEKLNTFNL